MNKIYRYQRHIYDLTRKFFLFGRDTVVKRMHINSGDSVLEMGCGTARNLFKLAKLRTDAKYYGLDASSEMLITAERKAGRKKLADRITFQHCLAEELDYQKTFGLDEPFDVIFYSYTLSMIPTWKEAVDASLANIKPGKTLYIVDFWDQKGLPWIFAKILKWWLSLFHVYFKPELLEYLYELESKGIGTLKIESRYGRYAYLAEFVKN